MSKPSPCEMNANEPRKSPSSNLFLFWVLPGAFSLLCIGAYFINFRDNPAGQPDAWGQFGDFFGGMINPIVGMITIILLVKTFRAQQEELRSQLEQAQESGDALKRQAQATALQSFEQTLFAWFGNYKQIIHSLSYQRPRDEDDDERPGPLVGLAAVKFWASTIRFRVLPPQHSEGEYFWMMRKKVDPSALTEEQINRAAVILLEKWTDLMTKQSAELGPALRTLYGIFKWISTRPPELLSSDMKRLYSGVIRAQLTDHELQLLFYNGLSRRGEAFVTYANEFALFDNLDNPNDFRVAILLLSNSNRYLPEAFGTNQPTHFREMPPTD